MTIGAGLAYGMFWVCSCITLLAWMRRPRHSHKWKEERREKIFRPSNKDIVGESVFCVCEGCGEHKMFKMKV